MMKQDLYTIKENVPLTDRVYRMVIEGDTTAIKAPGQFVNIKIDGLFLRRPISVCDYDDDRITLLYKVVGEGTRIMSKMGIGTQLDVLTGLGNGYDMEPSGDSPLLIGAGVGTPPLYGLAKRLRAEGKEVSVALGFHTASDVFYATEFDKLGCKVVIATSDGSMGVKGRVTDILPSHYTYFYTCGPEAMLRSVYDATMTSGQFSFEERMACGFGACMGCTCKTLYGNKRICKDGPVLVKEEIIWEK